MGETPASPPGKEEFAKVFSEHFDKLTPNEKALILKKMAGPALPPPPSSRSGYYSQKYAIQLKPSLQAAFFDEEGNYVEKEDPIILFFPYKEYQAWRPNTLYLYITNAFKYLCEHLDEPDGRFKLLRQKVVIHKHRDGIRIKADEGPVNYTLNAKIIPASQDNPEPVPYTGVDEEVNKRPSWESELIKFIELSTPGQKFEHSTHHPYEAEKQDKWNNFFLESDMFAGKVMATSIKVIRLDEAKMEALSQGPVTA